MRYFGRSFFNREHFGTRVWKVSLDAGTDCPNRDGHIGREGCLSVPDFTGNVIRAEKIKVGALDQHGEAFEFETEGYEARVIQHEVDHLDGLLFLDRLVSRRSDLIRRKKA